MALAKTMGTSVRQEDSRIVAPNSSAISQVRSTLPPSITMVSQVLPRFRRSRVAPNWSCSLSAGIMTYIFRPPRMRFPRERRLVMIISEDVFIRVPECAASVGMMVGKKIAPNAPWPPSFWHLR